MITVCHPVDEVEQILLVAELENAGIPYFINSQHFGSLFPGMQIPWYNERAIRVPPSCYEEALRLVNNFRDNYEPQSENLDATSKIRILGEAILFGWIIPYGNKRSSSRKASQSAGQPSDNEKLQSE